MVDTAETDKPSAKPPLSNGAIPLEVWSLWRTERACARELGIKNTTLRKLAETIGVEPYRAADGTKRFRTEDFDQLEAAHAARMQALDEDEETPKGSQSSALGQLVLLLKQSHAHNERLMELYAKPNEELNRRYEAMVDKLAKRCEALEAREDAILETRRVQLENEHDRQLEQRIIGEKLQRRERLFAQFEKELPGIFGAAREAFAFKFGLGEKLTGVAKLLESLDNGKLAMLLSEEFDFLNAEQRAAIEKAIGPDRMREIRTVQAEAAQADAAPKTAEAPAEAPATEGT